MLPLAKNIGLLSRWFVHEKKMVLIRASLVACRSVADSLKLGSNVMPELYKDASVYFSDIVSFTTLASESTPMEVVDFLNDLWTVFDDIINKFNVYKVRAYRCFVSR